MCLRNGFENVNEKVSSTYDSIYPLYKIEGLFYILMLSYNLYSRSRLKNKPFPLMWNSWHCLPLLKSILGSRICNITVALWYSIEVLIQIQNYSPHFIIWIIIFLLKLELCGKSIKMIVKNIEPRLYISLKKFLIEFADWNINQWIGLLPLSLKMLVWSWHLQNVPKMTECNKLMDWH